MGDSSHLSLTEKMHQLEEIVKEITNRPSLLEENIMVPVKQSRRKKDPNKYLLSSEVKCNANYIFDKEGTALHMAAHYGNAEFARQLICEDVDAVGDLGRTSLHTAASGGRVEVMEVLLCNGANIGAVDDLGDTPLHISAQEAPLGLKAETIIFLVDYGADVNAVNLLKETPLYLAASSRRSIEAVRALIERGAKVNGLDQCEDAPLHRAVRFSCFEVVKYLVEKGADINAVRKCDNSTPLHLAVKNNNLEIVKCLIDKGANVHAKDMHDKVPLDCAKEKRYEALMEYLAEKMRKMTYEKDEASQVHEYFDSLREKKI